MRKDRSILSALKDGEIHSPFREKCLEILESDQELDQEFRSLRILSEQLENAPEPDFEKSRGQMLDRILQRAHDKAPAPSPRPRNWTGVTGGLLLSWPAAASAIMVLGLGALAGGYALRASGMEISFRPPVSGENLALVREDRDSQGRIRQNPEIRVTVPKRFTLPADEEGELLLSSFEGGW